MIGYKAHKIKEKAVKADLSDVLCYLISGKGNSFYARILAAMQIQEDRRISSMAVILKNRYIALAHNMEWLRRADYEEVIATVEHEALHVVLEHIPRKLAQAANYQNEEEKKRFFRVTPFAEDMAVNCLLEDSNERVRDWAKSFRAEFVNAKKMPDEKSLEEFNKREHSEGGWVLPDMPPFGLPQDMTYEWYLREMMKRDKQDGEFSDFLKAMGPGAGGIQLHIDAHGVWEQLMSGLSDEEKMGLSSEIEQRVKEMVKKAVEEHSRSRGSVPSFLQELINKLLTPPRIPWTQVLRDKVVNTKRWKWQRSISRPNRRHVGMPLLCPFPGRRKDRTFTVVFCIDTSGSMGAPQLELALNELQHMQKTDREIEITVIECDAAVGKEYVLHYNTEVQFNLTGRGGTEFDPALKRAKELKPDIVFYYTDGYAPAPDPDSRVACPFVWLIAPYGHNPDENWGSVLVMEDR